MSTDQTPTPTARRRLTPADKMLQAADAASTERRSMVARTRHLAAVAVTHQAGDLAATMAANAVAVAQGLANLEAAYRAAAARLTRGGGR